MSFNPNLPLENTTLDAGEVRNNFNGLKAIFDERSGPVGSLAAWLKGFPNTPALTAGWAECNGQVLDDPVSPYHGQALPDLNGVQSGVAVFLRGAAVSGGTGGSETHNHNVDLNINGGSAQQGGDFVMVPPGAYNTAPASTLPSYYEVVWVVRVK